MNFVKAIAILIPRIFALAVADRLMPIAPFGQARIDILFIGINLCAGFDRRSHDRLNGGLLHIRQHANHDLAAPLQYPQDGRFLFVQRATPPSAFQSAPPAGAAFFSTAAGWPL